MTQRELAEHLGVSVPTLRKLRHEHLQAGDHYAAGEADSRSVVYTPEGIEKLRSALGLDPAVPRPVAVQSAATDPDEGVELTVASSPKWFGATRKHFPNQHVIQARDEAGAMHLVWVRESANFQPALRNGEPMRVRVVARGGRLELKGRCPRWPGCW